MTLARVLGECISKTSGRLSPPQCFLTIPWNRRSMQILHRAVIVNCVRRVGPVQVAFPQKPPSGGALGVCTYRILNSPLEIPMAVTCALAKESSVIRSWV